MFVDDEPRVLQGLRRMLRGMASEWEMVFCEGGEEALAQLERQPTDVLVSDIRMPRIDGVRLFEEARRRYPRTARIALSGHADEEMALRTHGIVHQFLSKPSEAATLRATINRVCALQDLLASEELAGFVSRLKGLPPLPALYAELLNSVDDPNASGRSIGQIISRDVSMTAKILHLANSAFFGVRRSVSDPANAVTVLGLHTIRNLVLSAGLFSLLDRGAIRSLTQEMIWAHSLETSMLARGLCRLEQGDAHSVEDAGSAGLLHDVGKIVMALEFGERYDAMLASAQGSGQVLVDLEREALGATHAEVGAYLLGIWGLPAPVVEAVAFHHDVRQDTVERFGPALAVSVANLLLRELEDPECREVTRGIATLEALGLADRLEIWRAHCASAHQDVQDWPQAG